MRSHHVTSPNHDKINKRGENITAMVTIALQTIKGKDLLWESINDIRGLKKIGTTPPKSRPYRVQR